MAIRVGLSAVIKAMCAKKKELSERYKAMKLELLCLEEFFFTSTTVCQTEFCFLQKRQMDLEQKAI